MITYLRKLRFTLQGGFLLRPLTLALGLGIAGALLSQMEEWMPAMNAWVPTILFPSKSDPAVAQIILSTIAAAMMTVVSIVFAVLLMSLTLASMQYSPRIIITFTEDKITQNTLGLFLGTFGFCIAALPAARSFPHPYSPVLSVTVAMILAFSCSCGLLVFINHIAEAISANHIIDRLARRTEQMIDEMLPQERTQTNVKPFAAAKTYTNQTQVISKVSGYVRYVDTRKLLHLAQQYQTNVEVIRRVGHYVPKGVAILLLSGNSKPEQSVLDDFLSAFDFGATRTLQQDVEFGILQIVDIALKAISPAVNDPSTGINCIDQLSAILIHLAAKKPPDGVLTDTDGNVWVSIPWLDFERLIDSAYEQIRMYSEGDAAVSLRMFRALGDIAQTVPDQATRQLLADRGRRILAGCAKNLEEDEMKEMKNRMRGLERMAAV